MIYKPGDKCTLSGIYISGCKHKEPKFVKEGDCFPEFDHECEEQELQWELKAGFSTSTIQDQPTIYD